MENATKALIMAASILIGVMILSLGVYLFVTLGSYAKDVEDENRQNQIAQFNIQFLSYKDKDGGLTIYDVITLANTAKNYNDTNGLIIGDDEYISVNLEGNRNFEQKVNNFNLYENQEYVYKENSTELRKYKCKTILVSELTQKVKQITIVDYEED